MSGLVHENPGPPAFTAVGLPIGEAASLPPACYTDDAFLAREFREIFRPNWCGVGRGDRVAEARSYAAFDLAGVPVLLIRDAGGYCGPSPTAAAIAAPSLPPTARAHAGRSTARFIPGPTAWTAR